MSFFGIQLSLMAHVFFGVMGFVLAVAIFVYVLNANEKNIARIRKMSLMVPLFMIFSYIVGGWWYVVHYYPERDIIKSGSWVWAHTFFMEFKEHLFFVLLMLSILLPIIVYKNDLITEKGNRNLVLTILALIVLLGFTMDGAGAIISRGVIVGLMGR
jgi:hypothetical protein